ncbi:hypothetical protein ACF9IK_30260 [Kitasatospora hibisci]|uniref:hypothetical protein n=1 Tax=Kitasatospora hibisci TaxID=3369522 RepID=UPI003754AF6C
MEGIAGLMQLVFHYNHDVYSCDHLFLPAERFPAWRTRWRRDVQAAFAAMP